MEAVGSASCLGASSVVTSPFHAAQKRQRLSLRAQSFSCPFSQVQCSTARGSHPSPGLSPLCSLGGRSQWHPRRNAGPAAASARGQGERGSVEAREKQGSDSNKDIRGAGLSWVSPEWLTGILQSLRGPDDSGIPVADAKLEDVKDLLGGALFLPLFKWMIESGPVYRLAAGPRNFVIIGEPEAAKHVLQRYGPYSKGLVAEVAEFLFGSGFAIAEGELWAVRRKAVVPALHRRYLSTMVDRVFAPSALRLAAKLSDAARREQPVNVEACFSQLTLDVIGKAIFNFDFDSITVESPLIQAVYTALKETESRSTDILPYWQVPFLRAIDPRQRAAAAAVALIRSTVEELVAKCRAIVETEGERLEGDEYVNDDDPSVLRFLLASREEVSSTQLRDDLLSMLVAGHETTGSVLTWTLYLLIQNPRALARAKEEIAAVLGRDRVPTFSDTRSLKYLTRCINESMRLYPHPPVLIRRAQQEDVLPGGYKLKTGQDVMVSVYNIHHSPQVWEDAEDFRPERFDLEAPIPTEVNTNFRYIPFSGGPRKCVGDQFAMLEAIMALAVLVQRFDFALVPGQDISMTTGATIHTKHGLYTTVTERLELTALQPAAVAA